MANRFYVVTVRHPEGERLPILLDADRQPIVWINLYIIRTLRPRLSFNSLLKCTRILGYLFDWAARQKSFSLRTRLTSGNGLTHAEIEGSLYPWLRKNFRSNRKVRTLVVRSGSVDYRLDVVWEFIKWHMQDAITRLPIGSGEIGEVEAKLKACKHAFENLSRGRHHSPVHARALSDVELERLLSICQPGSLENPWKKPYQERNWLIIRLMVMLGVRRGELLKVRVSDCHLSRSIPEIRIERSPDDVRDPRINEPQVKTESRQLPCDRQLASDLNQFIVRTRVKIPRADRTPYLFQSRTGQPMSLNRVNGILEQIGKRHPEFADLHPHCLRSTCATGFRAMALKRGLEEAQVEKDMMYFFGWRSEGSIAPYVDDAIRGEAAEIGLIYQAQLFGPSSRLGDSRD
ncbi:site-specific integrase [Burkholderia orbicola]|uniref:site-specific integrase n=1 Tax=Burkholderia orbicola TaxID=2978683 RepID=UPI002FE30220